MSKSLGGYDFNGPFNTPDSLNDDSGVYAILTGSNDDTVVYVGESEGVYTRVTDNHEKEEEWEKHKDGSLKYAAYYCDEDDRERIEQELIEKYDPPANG